MKLFNLGPIEANEEIRKSAHEAVDAAQREVELSKIRREALGIQVNFLTRGKQ